MVDEVARRGDDGRDHSALSRVKWQYAGWSRLHLSLPPPWRNEGGQPRIATSVASLAYLLQQPTNVLSARPAITQVSDKLRQRTRLGCHARAFRKAFAPDLFVDDHARPMTLASDRGDGMYDEDKTPCHHLRNCDW
jgi:hypothetical protein